MKLLLFLLVMPLVAASPALSQTRKSTRTKSKQPARATGKAAETKPLPVYSSAEAPPPPPPPPPPAPKPLSVTRQSSDAFKDLAVGKWGVVSLSVPEDLMSEFELEKPEVGGNTAWTTYSRSWKQADVNFPSALEADLTVTTWNAEFKALVPELKPHLATPEHFILIDLLGDFDRKNKPDSLVKEIKPMAIGGVDGGFFRADAPSSDKHFLAGWYTYRYYKGKAQRISPTATGRKVELQKAMKIIESLRIQEAPERRLSDSF